MDGLPAYDEDFFAWTQAQGRLLREAAGERVNLPLDFEHLAGEIEDMGKSDHRAIAAALARVIEHLLKLELSPAPEPRGGWRRSVREHRASINDALADSPSLRGRIDLAKYYRRGRDYAVDGLATDGIADADLPASCPYTLDQILDEGWWPANRRGVEG